IGEDQMGFTFRAKDAHSKQFAVKLLKPGVDRDDVSWKQFWNEACAAAALQDPRLATFQVGEIGGQIYLAMELLKGESLENRLKRGALPLRQALWVAREAALGLATAHQAGHVHRDIRPANLWFERSDMS